MFRTFAAVVLTLALAGFAYAAGTAGSQLQTLLSADEFKNAGLEKLTPDELAALEAALIKHHALPKSKKSKAKSSADATSVGPSAERHDSADDSFGAEQISRPKSVDTPDEMHSRIEGTVQEFSGRAVFVLENGQIWQQRIPQAYYLPKKLVNPEVVIMKGLGGYKMVIVAADAVVFVRRIQ